MIHDRGFPGWSRDATVGEVQRMTPQQRGEYYRALIKHWSRGADGSLQCDTQYDHQQALDNDEFDIGQTGQD